MAIRRDVPVQISFTFGQADALDTVDGHGLSKAEWKLSTLQKARAITLLNGGCSESGRERLSRDWPVPRQMALHAEVTASHQTIELHQHSTGGIICSMIGWVLKACDSTTSPIDQAILCLEVETEHGPSTHFQIDALSEASAFIRGLSEIAGIHCCYTHRCGITIFESSLLKPCLALRETTLSCWLSL